MAGKDPETDKPRGPPPTGLPAPEKLPPGLQKIVDKADKDESLYDELYEGTYVSMLQRPNPLKPNPQQLL
jgi:fission process protein 1